MTKTIPTMTTAAIIQRCLMAVILTSPFSDVETITNWLVGIEGTEQVVRNLMFFTAVRSLNTTVIFLGDVQDGIAPTARSIWYFAHLTSPFSEK